MNDAIKLWMTSEGTLAVVRYLKKEHKAATHTLVYSEGLTAGATARLIGRVRELSDLMNCLEDENRFSQKVLGNR